MIKKSKIIFAIPGNGAAAAAVWQRDKVWREKDFFEMRLKIGRVQGSSTTTSVTRLGDLLDFGQLLKPMATILLPKSPAFLGNYFKGVKIYHISSEIVFEQHLLTFGDFFWSHWLQPTFPCRMQRKSYLVWLNKIILMGSGCGSYGHLVAFDARNSWFESGHREF